MTEGLGVLADPEKRGRVFELAVAFQLLQMSGEIFNWREKNAEVDYVYRYQGKVYVIEVKSGRRISAKDLEAL